MSLHIRKAVPDDFTALLAVEEAAFLGDGYSPYFLKMAPLLYPHTCFVAVSDEVVVGYSLGARDGSDATLGWILTVAVIPSFHGQGTGQKLTEALMQAMVALGMRTQLLTVAPTNPARKLYHKLGFAEVGLERDCYGPGQDRLYMERRVSHENSPCGN